MGTVPHDQAVEAILRDHPETAIEYLRAALQESPSDFVEALRKVAQIYLEGE